MRAAGLVALLLAGWSVGAQDARAEAPERSLRPMPRPVVATEVPAAVAVAAAVLQEVAPAAAAADDAAVTSAVASALAVMASPRPLPKPRDVVASAAPAGNVIGAPRPVVPRVSAANKPPVDPIAAFFQGLAAPKPAAAAVAAVPAAAPSGLAVPQSPRPEGRPNGFATLVAAITTPRATSRKGSVCGVPEIKGEAIRAIDGAGACGVEQPVKITSVSGVPVSGGPTIDCTTAIALNDWVRHGVMQAVGRTGGGLAQVNVIASYSCRSRNNVRGAKLSEHSFGHAIDVSGVTLKDGTTLTVLDHWRSGKYGSVIKAMHSSACGTFGTVLGPNADRYHQNHLHLDTARYRSGSYCR